ncbi:hypothetical protein P5815_29355 [Bacillus cereus]|uniref:hypothetical protein n=1 Tax=Bacillus cereus TaxID=1396 RepID=UPI002406838F|nr:hypothetical protein [Bacillus cereus]MDF9524603.1 hypothetical protein [Bacillus cereus]MDF9564347.1 hypothetical protein [Bacillus cereus]
MKKFVCTVTRVDKFTIALDENKMNASWLENFKNNFYDIEDLKGHADMIAQYRARFGHECIEGYGIPLENGKPPIGVSEEDRRIFDAINIHVVSEDNNCEVEVKEIGKVEKDNNER